MSFEKKAAGTRPPRIVSAETMLEAIRELGIVPFFQNLIPGCSIEEMTAPEYWFDTQENLSRTPWDWKIPCIQSGEIAYGKFLLGGKAAFATVEWYKELRNYRQAQPKYRPDEAQQKILAFLKENGSIGIKDIRGLLNIKKGQADTLASRLMMQCRLITGDITRVYRGEDLSYKGWQTSSFCTPEALFGEEAPAGFPFGPSPSLKLDHSPEESRRRLEAHLRQIAPGITERQIQKLLG